MKKPIENWAYEDFSVIISSKLSEFNILPIFRQPRLSALALLYFMYFTSLALFFVSLVNDDAILNYSEFNLILSLTSLLIFVVVATIGLLNRGFYFLCLPLVVLAVPNAINDLLPSFWAGPLFERGAASVSLINHVDLYLLAGVVLFSDSEKRLGKYNNNVANALTLIALFVVLTSILWWVIVSSFVEHNPLLFFGNSFQLRYLIYISLMIRFVNDKDIKHFNWGLYMAIGFVLLESTVYSLMFQVDQLTSGNFGTNTLGVLFGFLLLYVFSTEEVSSRIKIILICLMSFALFLTGTRTAILALLLSFGLSKLIARYGFLWVGLISILFVLCCFLVYWDVIVLFLGPLILLLQTDYAFLESQNLVGGALSSVITRLSLWVASFNMIYDFPFGVGLSQFNSLKADYGFSIPVFIDPHNDYLNFFLQYGIINGFILISTLFAYPLITYLGAKSHGSRNLNIQLMIFIVITSFSNCNFNKHQFFFMFVFVVFVAIKQRSQAFNKKTTDIF